MPFTLSFGEVPGGRTVVCEDSFRAITLAVNAGRADRHAAGRPGDPVVIGRVHRHLGQAATKVSVVDGPPASRCRLGPVTPGLRRYDFRSRT